MKQGLLISGLILIALLAVFNCSMIYDGNGIGLWISAIFSVFGIPFPLLLLFVRSKSKWVLPTLLVALATLGFPIFISEYHSSLFRALQNTLLPLNIVLIGLCKLSVRSVIKVDCYSKPTEGGSSGS